MNTLDGEKILSSHSSLIVTNFRLIKEKKSWGRVEQDEIPLKKIDSISYKKIKINHSLLVLGIILLIIGFLLSGTILLSAYYSNIIMFLGIIVVIIGIFLRKEVVEFRAGTLKISAEKKGMEELVDTLREEIYK